MANVPTIETDRLRLRAFVNADAALVQNYCAEREIAATTLSIPHPYPENGAAEWIATHESLYDRGKSHSFAIETKRDDELVGSIGLGINKDHRWAELGYVIYRPFWGNGYATEAARRIVRYAFADVGLHRVQAHHFAGNDASGRVMQNIDMRYEGTMRDNICKWGEMKSTHFYAILSTD